MRKRVLDPVQLYYFAKDSKTREVFNSNKRLSHFFDIFDTKEFQGVIRGIIHQHRLDYLHLSPQTLWGLRYMGFDILETDERFEVDYISHTDFI